MTVSDLIEQVDVQGEVKIVYFDENSCNRLEIDRQRSQDLEIQYMYCRKNILYIDVKLD